VFPSWFRWFQNLVSYLNSSLPNSYFKTVVALKVCAFR
jgi:hypothetical protein